MFVIPLPKASIALIFHCWQHPKSICTPTQIQVGKGCSLRCRLRNTNRKYRVLLSRVPQAVVLVVSSLLFLPSISDKTWHNMNKCVEAISAPTENDHLKVTLPYDTYTRKTNPDPEQRSCDSQAFPTLHSSVHRKPTTRWSLEVEPGPLLFPHESPPSLKNQTRPSLVELVYNTSTWSPPSKPRISSEVRCHNYFPPPSLPVTAFSSSVNSSFSLASFILQPQPPKRPGLQLDDIPTSDDPIISRPPFPFSSNKSTKAASLSRAPPHRCPIDAELL